MSLIGQHNSVRSASDTVELPQVSQVKTHRTLLTPTCLWTPPKEYLHYQNTRSRTVSLKATDLTHLQVVFLVEGETVQTVHLSWKTQIISTQSPHDPVDAKHFYFHCSPWPIWMLVYTFKNNEATCSDGPFTVRWFVWTVVCSKASTWTGIRVFSYTVTTGCISFNLLLNTLAGSMQTDGRDVQGESDQLSQCLSRHISITLTVFSPRSLRQS